MMQELTLTGATLMPEESSNGVELSTLKKEDPLVPAASNNGHSHGHHSHGHQHQHQNNQKMMIGQKKKCCPHDHSHGHQHVVPMINAMPVEELLTSTVEDQQKAISSLIRLGTYVALEPLINALVDAGEVKDVLDRLGEEGHSLVHWAAKRTDDIRFLTLVCKHCSVETLNVPSNDNVGMRPLHWACTEGRVPHVATLIRHGAKIEETDKSGCSPLLIAAQYGHVELVGYLVQQKANIQAIDKHWDTALHWAAYKGSLPVCGLLLYQGLGSWISKPDSYGQTPVHLSSLRGQTSAVRYLLQESTLAQKREVLTMKDKNGKTPLDLAIHKKRPNVEAVLREAEDLYLSNGRRGCLHSLKKQCASLVSCHAWQTWFGCTTTNADEMDEAPKLPFFITVSHMAMAGMAYPLLFTPFDVDKGIVWDKGGLHVFSFICQFLMWFTFIKTWKSDPGTLDERHPKTKELRRQYEETLEAYSDENFFARNDKAHLCHSCHIARPLRSKHCRVARRCVLMFDHHCPFVGNTIGLHNYRWFFLMLLTMFLSYSGWYITFVIYLNRKFSVGFLIFGLYLGIFFLMVIGMLIYHMQLSLINLTTNEHQNVLRYKYLQNSRGKYFNPFFRGLFGNFVDRMFPSDSSYTIQRRPQEELSLMKEQDGGSTEVNGDIV